MKLLLINGSPRANGCTFTALNEVANTLKENGVESEIIQVGGKAISGCVACWKCGELGKCVFNGIVHGTSAEETLKDIEGLQTLRVLGRNMAFLIKSIALGKEKYGLPEKEERVWRNFIS
jgi:hypothetical protein